MRTTDTSEAGLESVIVAQMVAGGWIQGDPHDYDWEFAVDFEHLTAFLEATQPEVAEAVAIRDDDPTRRKFLSRLQGEITKRGIVDVLRNGIQTGPTDAPLFYGTFELKNQLTKQTYADEVSTREDVRQLVRACVATYNADLDEDRRVAFKASAKAFVRGYGLLSQILPWSKPEWEELSIFLQQLIPKLPAQREDDLARGILETVDIESYRAEKLEARRIALPDENAALEPLGPGGFGRPEPEMDRLSNIVKAFNDMFGDIDWEDRDRVERILTQELPARVRADKQYRNAMANSDRQNARIEHDAALGRAMQSFLTDDTELYKQFSDNEDFRRWLTETIFVETYEPGAGPGHGEGVAA